MKTENILLVYYLVELMLTYFELQLKKDKFYDE